MPELEVVTWNLMGLNEQRLDERTEAACQTLLLRDPPDVVLLQEVVSRTLYAHVLPHFAAAGFTVAPRQPVSDSEYFCVIATRPGLKATSAWRRPFPGSGMGRALLCLEVEWEGMSLRVCTSHLESLREGADERRRQGAVLVEALTEHAGPALFGGDTNLRGDGADILGEQVHDAWIVAGSPAESQATWWPLSGRGPRLRFDRLWLGPGWELVSLRREPDRRVQGMRLSDHVALRARLRWQGPVD